MTENTDGAVRRVSRREAMAGAGVALGSLVASGTLTDTVMAQSGGPSDEISGIVEDETGAVQGATVVAVPHDTSLAALETTTDANGEYIFEQSDLHEDSNLYHVIARDGTETDPRRGVPNYPFIAAEGFTIPDSEADQKLAHRWILDDVNGTVEDSVGSADGTVNGVASTSGDWAGGSAGDGDGTDDYIRLPISDLSTWVDGSSNGASIAFSIQTTATSGDLLGTDSQDDEQMTRVIIVGGGELDCRYGANSHASMETSGAGINDGTAHRVVWNFSDSDPSTDWDIYVDGNEIGSENFATAAAAQPNIDMALFASIASGGSPGSFTDTILDDVCFYDSQLTASEVGSYDAPWQ